MSEFSIPVKPDYEEFLQVIRREKTPKRVHHIEIFHDGDVAQELEKRFEIGKDLDPNDAHYGLKRSIAYQRFMGYDFVMGGVAAGWPPVKVTKAEDTSETLNRESGRTWLDEGLGIIQTWEDFEKYPWNTFTDSTTATLEWLTENLPDDMMIMGAGVGNFAEYLSWLFGYEGLCFAIYEKPDLVHAVKQKLEETYSARVRLMMQFDRVKAVWAFDDMGFKTGLMFGVPATREFILPGHKLLASLCHEAGRPYLLHCCGNINEIVDEMIDDVKVDAKHSFEDTIEDVREVKHTYGKKMTLLGGIDVDFLCRSDEKAIRKRVRETIDTCLPGGGWCLGTGNSVANYIPLENYLAMVDEGRRYEGA